ncbi:hypothetical protein LCR01_03260 [Companilactobacillus crustorum]|uniref:Uncharacterized protein n=1 Tax=Companilactobacillus crustorum TaxID=392416 RepID=A0AB34A991_9LACO|nr:hypothetical protein LCR01_03260 [Companilactobacillus crustorum]
MKISGFFKQILVNIFIPRYLVELIIVSLAISLIIIWILNKNQ